MRGGKWRRQCIVCVTVIIFIITVIIIIIITREVLNIKKKKKNGRDVTFPSSSVPVCNRHAYAQSPLMHIKIPCPFMVKSRSRTERPAVYVGEEGGFCSLR